MQYHGVIVISLLAGNDHLETMQSKLEGTAKEPYSADKKANLEIGNFCQQKGIDIPTKASYNKSADKNFLICAVVHDSKSNDPKEMIFAECGLFKDNNGAIFLPTANSNTISKENHELLIEDLQSFLNLRIEQNYRDSGFLQIESSDKAIEKVAFYIEFEKGSSSLNKLSEAFNSGGEIKTADNSEKASKPLALYGQNDAGAIKLFAESNTTSDRRTKYQSDYERIVHTKAFRRLVDKAQVFSSSKGDHFRTRMTHTLEVNQIARAISSALGLNMMLTESIALAHDIGHTPFGHQGERSLDDILRNRTLKELDLYGLSGCSADNTAKEPCNPFGGFKHNFQSVRVLQVLEENHIEFEGINISAQVLEGALWHTKVPKKGLQCNGCSQERTKCCEVNCYCTCLNEDTRQFWDYAFHLGDYESYSQSLTLEGQVVAVADEIAQRSHDIDDALASGILTIEELVDLSKIRSVEGLHKSLVQIKLDIEQAKSNGRMYIEEKRLQKERIASAIIRFLIRSVLDGSQIEGKVSDQILSKNFGYVITDRVIKFDDKGKGICDYLENLTTSRVLNSQEISCFDNKGAMIVEGLFKAYYLRPLMLPKTSLRKMAIMERANKFSRAIDLSNCDAIVSRKEIKNIQEASVLNMPEKWQPGQDLTNMQEYALKKRLLVRTIVDYISGMTDSYAMNEYQKIYGCSM